MRIHENGGKTGYRSDSTCGYCREEGHNQYQCPKVAQDYEFFKQYKIPVDDNGKVIRRGWYGSYPDSWGKWYQHCLKTYHIQQERKQNKATTPRKSSPRKCGFCDNPHHTRRNCPTMAAFLKDCHAANIKWRKAAYKELVQTHGISVGAAIKVKKVNRSYWNDSENPSYFSGIITSINWDTLTVFTAMEKYPEDAHSPIKIRVLLSNGETVTINNFENRAFHCLGDKGAAPNRYNYGEKYSINSIVAPAKILLGEDWINGYKGAFSTLTKKRSYHQLQHGLASQYSAPNLVDHINRWK